MYACTITIMQKKDDNLAILVLVLENVAVVRVDSCERSTTRTPVYKRVFATSTITTAIAVIRIPVVVSAVVSVISTAISTIISAIISTTASVTVIKIHNLFSLCLDKFNCL